MSPMKNLRTVVLAGFVACSAWAAPALAGDPPAAVALEQSASPEAIVDAQLAAYNRRDLEGFLSFYAEDAVLAEYPDEVTQTGKAEMRTRYRQRFSNPNVRAEILRRITFGGFVIDHERVVTSPATSALEAVAIYEIRDGKIVRVTFLQK